MAYARSNIAQKLNGPSITAGPTRTAADTAVCSPADSPVVIEAGQIIAGTKLRIRLAGKVSTVITTPGVIQFLVKFGSITVFDSGAVLGDTVVAHTDKPFVCEMELDCRVAGASTTAKFIGTGILFSESILGVPATMPKANAVAVLPWSAAPAVGTGFDSTIANILTVHSTQTVATGSLTVEQWTVEQIG
jgi:hypothetical protein